MESCSASAHHQCVSRIAGLSGRDFFFTKSHQSSLNSEFHYSAAKGFVPELHFSFFRVFFETLQNVDLNKT